MADTDGEVMGETIEKIYTGTGDGSKVVKATVLEGTGLPHGMMLNTPEGMPNIVIKAVSRTRRFVVRIARVYVQSLVGFLPLTLGAGQAIANQVAPDTLVLPTEFGDQLMLAAALAIAPSAGTLLTNLSEWLIKQDETKA
jgi:hypothetical protein